MLWRMPLTKAVIILTEKGSQIFIDKNSINVPVTLNMNLLNNIKHSHIKHS